MFLHSAHRSFSGELRKQRSRAGPHGHIVDVPIRPSQKDVTRASMTCPEFFSKKKLINQEIQMTVETTQGTSHRGDPPEVAEESGYPDSQVLRTFHSGEGSRASIEMTSISEVSVTRPTLRSVEESTLLSDCQERRHSIVEPSSQKNSGSCYKRIPSVSSQLPLRDGSTPRVGPGRAESTSRPHSAHTAHSSVRLETIQCKHGVGLVHHRHAVLTNNPVSKSRGNRCRQQ